MNDLMKEYIAQIEALRKEIERLNDEIKKFKELAFKAQLSDPIYHTPLSEIETKFEIITPEKL